MIRERNKNGGMSWMVDIRDWLGGWPREYTSHEDPRTLPPPRL
jgi:hypothetical protein